MSSKVLRVRVSPGALGDALHGFIRAAESAQAGRSVRPQFSVGFSEVGAMLAAFTPKRWELMGVLRESGPCSVRALAGKLGRDYKNVHTDVAALELWMAVERLDDGRVWVPWDEISVDLQLPQAVAA